jgi:hypothetical protein
VIPAAWLANRNALITSFFGIAALIAHDRWRRDGWRAGVVVGPVLFTLSLLAKEAGIATCAYLFAYAVFLDRGSKWGRFLTLVPYGVLVVVWRIVWTVLGYGVWGIEIYVDPLVEPFQYAAAVLERAPVLLLGQFLLPPSEVYIFCADLGAGLLYTAVATIIVILVGAVVLARLQWDRTTRFWALGMTLALLPVCAMVPADRVLSFVGLGAFALLARFFSATFDRVDSAPDARPSRRLARTAKVVGVGLLGVHGVLAPLALSIRSAMPVGPAFFIENLQVHLSADQGLERQSVIVVTAPLPLLVSYLPVRRALDGLPVPAHTHVLAPAYPRPVAVTRSDSRTLVVRPAGGYLAMSADLLTRSSRNPMPLGHRVELTEMTAEVTALTADGRPAEAEFRFSVPLEDPSLRWLAWGNPSYVPFTPPAIGETVALPPTSREE